MQKSSSSFLSNGKGNKPMAELSLVEQDEPSNLPPTQKGLNLRPLLRLLQRKAWLVLGITGIVTGAAWLANTRAQSTYQGAFQLLVEPATNEAKITDPSALARLERGASIGSQNFSTVDYPTQLQILKSPKMLSEIYTEISPQYPKLSYLSLEKDLTVARVGENLTNQTKIIEVTYKNQDPKLVESVLKVTANKYLKYSLQERKTRISEGIKFIEEQLPPLQRRVSTLQSRLQILQQRYKITDPKVQGEQLFAQLRQIDGQQLAVQRDLQEQTKLYTNIQSQLKLTPDEAMAASALSENPRYRDLLTSLKDIEVKIAIESGRFQANSPAIETLEFQRQKILALLNQERNGVIGVNSPTAARNPQVLAFQNSIRIDLIKKLIESANNIKLLQVRKQAIDQARVGLAREAQQFPVVALNYNELQRNLDISIQTLNQLLTQRETLRVEAAQKQVPWELVSNPAIPKDETGQPVPDSSDSRKNLILGAILGLISGLIAAVLLEKFQNTFFSPEDIKDATRIPVLTEIPYFRQVEQSSAPIKETRATNPIAVRFQSAFDVLYANIRLCFVERPVRSLAVCSAAPKEGKSTVAFHLAQTAAAMGQRVLLVDANVYEPHIYTKLNLSNVKGLSDLLTHNQTSFDLIQRFPFTNNFFILTSGQPLTNSQKLLGSDRMQQLMKEFAEKYDLVIYDTPNLLDSIDVNFLAAHTDGVLVVVGTDHSKRSVAMRAINQMSNFKLPIVGIAVNQAGRNAKYSDSAYSLPPIRDKALSERA